MIIGLGSDLIDIRRIARSLERFGDRFTDRFSAGAQAFVIIESLPAE